MELTSPKNLRKKYIEVLADNSTYIDILPKIVDKQDTDPILYYQNLNYEDIPNHTDEQRELLEISMDINSINSGFIEMKNEIVSIIDIIDQTISEVNSSIEKEAERISDINTICAQNSNFNMVVPIYASDFNKSDFENINNKFYGSKLVDQDIIEYDIVDISGNGIDGNNFVYIEEDDEFENIENDYSNKTYITDDNDITKFEYSRYITTSKDETVDGIINYDQKPVEMCITLSSSQVKFNKITWTTETSDLTVLKLETSDDGIVYTQRSERPLEAAKSDKLYNDSTYIYGSNILCFPYSYFVRITFSSNEKNNDTIAIEDKENDKIVVYPNTVRKKIAINNIKLYKSKYSDTVLESENIIVGGSIDKIALFASEYIPNHFPDNTYIQYFLIINGIEYEIVPVNSGKDDIKIIKFAKQSSPENDTYIQTISENIKTARIKIIINSYNDSETPYIGNIKLCLGKETESLYV